MRLSAKVLESVYTGLRCLPPFSGWKLPAPSSVEFKVIKSTMVYGDYDRDPEQIRISRVMCKTHKDVIQTMAHEMVHCALEMRGQSTAHADHSDKFWEYAQEVCAAFGWNVKEF